MKVIFPFSLGEPQRNGVFLKTLCDFPYKKVIMFQQIPIDQIEPNPVQPRISYDDADMAELAGSVGTHGVFQPLRVFWWEPSGKYRIKMGERRWRSAGQAKLIELPCIVDNPPKTLSEFLVQAVAENEQRDDLEHLELAWALRTHYLLRNLHAMMSKYGDDDELYFLQGLDERVYQVAEVGENLIGEDRAKTRQQEVVDFLATMFSQAVDALGLSPNWKPLVTWETITQELGLRLDQRRRRQVMEALNLTPTVQAEIIGHGVSERAARKLAKQRPEAQEEIVVVLKEHGAPLGDVTEK
ncbi:MAG: ParB/RepB/Spo0J family partition protein [Chloroflexi bacterium]|nr:ParB/RepB/Spo0J family partition protein [Chloroflexota bacterium]